MEGIIDLIFSNPFLLILIIGGLYSLFKRKTEQQESEKDSSPQRPVETHMGPQPGRRQQSRTQPEPQRGQYTRTQSHPERSQQPRTQPQPAKETIETQTLAEHKQQQLNDLKKRLNANNDTKRNHEVVVSDRIRKQQINNLVSKYDDEPFNRRFKENVTRTGLINSVIMSEVLGPPRAMKPYEGMRFKRKYHR